VPITRVAVCQYAIDVDDPAGTLERLHASVAEAAESKPDVIVFPELCTSGYVFRDIAEAQSRAESVDGPTVELFRELSLQHRTIVVGGFCERSDGERPFNSAAVVENGEVLVGYRKRCAALYTVVRPRERSAPPEGARTPPARWDVRLHGSPPRPFP
jgi:predicted amidohydrolase